MENHNSDERQGDMICNLNNLPAWELKPQYKMKRVFPGEKDLVLKFIEENFDKPWVYEAEHAIMQEPVKCFIVTENSTIVGFACYDSSARGYFGPIGVSKDKRGEGLGEALTLRTLQAMYEYGYGYAIIGWVGPAKFYEKVCGATFIPGGEPQNTVYRNLTVF
ncbi:MAG: GNAT family N-acetyltransferase [Treponemataceae bacterium]|nr:GNAT family N-acetyltransferase [Treponemataceae bacterium]